MEDDPIKEATVTDSRQILDQPCVIRAPRFLKGTNWLITIPLYMLYAQKVVTHFI